MYFLDQAFLIDQLIWGVVLLFGTYSLSMQTESSHVHEHVLPGCEADPCWHRGAVVWGPFTSGASHVRILWPVKLAEKNRSWVQGKLPKTKQKKDWGNEACLYLTLHTKDARKTLSSAEILFDGSGVNSLSSATVNAAFFPTLDDLYSRKFLFLV